MVTSIAAAFTGADTPPKRQEASTTTRAPTSASAEDHPALIIGLSPEAKEELEKSDDLAKRRRSENAKNAKDETPVSSRTELTLEQINIVDALRARDSEVRAHEAAHQAAGGGSAGAASFTYQTGPDGKQYAVGGEVPISIGGGNTPQQRIANAQLVRAAAMAPVNPSTQDMRVASRASQIEAAARRELSEMAMVDFENQTRKFDPENPDAPPPPKKEYGGPRADGLTGHTHMSSGCGFCSASIRAYVG
jgi:hypothetical protein